ncbi:MAG: exo-alpha-sialidase [Lentisphaeria bacterium]|nr:exo-alpha-sialidase [Lentisphaeria bacterium]
MSTSAPTRTDGYAWGHLCSLVAVGVGVAAACAAAEGAAEPSIRWLPESLRLLVRGGNYGRMIRLRDGRVMACFDRGGHGCVALSTDDGTRLAEPVRVATFPHGVATNCELLQLHDGAILLFVNERPREVGEQRFGIRVYASRDSGASWQDHALAYQAGARPENGCWEPAAIQLADGEIELFFANEFPYPESREQEITLLRSHDEGRSWGPPERVAFRPGRRDGMPVPLLLGDGSGIAVAIEDQGVRGKLQPAILFSTLELRWRQPCIGPDSPQRWPALRSPPPPRIYAGAPYLRQFPRGTTILSYQTDEFGEAWTLAVALGDPSARNFGTPVVPFRPDAGRACLWNSLFIRDEQTVTALSTTTIGGVPGLWAIDGRLEP